MIKAVVNNGVVVPRDPLPPDWQEGTEVEAERTGSGGAVENGIHPTDAWMNEVERCAAQQDPADDLRLQQAIEEERRAAKEHSRNHISST